MKNSKMTIWLVVAVVVMTISGCSANLQLDSNGVFLEPQKKIVLNVAEVDIINDAPIEKHYYISTFPSAGSTAESPFRETIQSQFHHIIIKFLNNLIAGNQTSEKKAIVRINRAVGIVSFPAARNIPVIGLLFVGEKDEYITIISGNIEIEDNQGHVIDKASFNVQTKIKKSIPWDTKESMKFTNELIRKTIPSLEQEIEKTVNRYLYKYWNEN